MAAMAAMFCTTLHLNYSNAPTSFTLIVQTHLPPPRRETCRFVLHESFPEKHCPALLHTALNNIQHPVFPNCKKSKWKENVSMHRGTVLVSSLIRGICPACPAQSHVFLKEGKEEQGSFILSEGSHWVTDSHLSLSHTHTHTVVQTYLILLLCFALLYFADTVFYKSKVCGNSASNKTSGTIFPTVFAHFMSMCDVLVILTILKLIFFVMVICDKWSLM